MQMRLRNLARKKEGELTPPAPGVAGDADLAPLEFLLSVMNDPDATPRQRIKAARVAARYHHSNRRWVEPEIAVKDQFGFDFDLATAKAMRDDELFAKATAATSRGLRPSSDVNQGSVLAAFEQSSTVCALLTSRRRR